MQRTGVAMHICNPSSQEDGKVEASLGYKVRPCLKKKKKKEEENQRTKQKQESFANYLNSFLSWRCSSVVESSPSLHKALGSISSPANKNR
jgi:hypothetical protein